MQSQDESHEHSYPRPSAPPAALVPSATAIFANEKSGARGAHGNKLSAVGEEYVVNAVAVDETAMIPSVSNSPGVMFSLPTAQAEPESNYYRHSITNDGQVYLDDIRSLQFSLATARTTPEKGFQRELIDKKTKSNSNVYVDISAPPSKFVQTDDGEAPIRSRDDETVEYLTGKAPTTSMEEQNGSLFSSSLYNLLPRKPPSGSMFRQNTLDFFKRRTSVTGAEALADAVQAAAAGEDGGEKVVRRRLQEQLTLTKTSAEDCTGCPEEATHLIVLEHGLQSTVTSMTTLRMLFLQAFKKEAIYIHMARSNQGLNTYTHQGVDAGGKRLANEVETLSQQLPKLRKFSIICHSLGGLYARYAIGILYSTGFFNKVEPVNFVTMASPHLGVAKPSSGVSDELFNKVFTQLFARTGDHLFLKDTASKETISIAEESKKYVRSVVTPMLMTTDKLARDPDRARYSGRIFEWKRLRALETIFQDLKVSKLNAKSNFFGKKTGMSFTGPDFIDWMIRSSWAVDRESAIVILRRLIKGWKVTHLPIEHSPKGKRKSKTTSNSTSDAFFGMECNPIAVDIDRKGFAKAVKDGLMFRVLPETIPGTTIPPAMPSVFELVTSHFVMVASWLSVEIRAAKPQPGQQRDSQTEEEDEEVEHFSSKSAIRKREYYCLLARAGPDKDSSEGQVSSVPSSASALYGLDNCELFVYNCEISSKPAFKFLIRPTAFLRVHRKPTASKGNPAEAEDDLTTTHLDIELETGERVSISFAKTTTELEQEAEGIIPTDVIDREKAWLQALDETNIIYEFVEDVPRKSEQKVAPKLEEDLTYLNTSFSKSKQMDKEAALARLSATDFEGSVSSANPAFAELSAEINTPKSKGKKKSAKSRFFSSATSLFSSGNSSASNVVDGNKTLPTLLYMTRGGFYAGLAMFKRRIIYANIKNDFLVPYITASISPSNPYVTVPPERSPKVSIEYPHIVVDTVNNVKLLRDTRKHADNLRQFLANDDDDALYESLTGIGADPSLSNLGRTITGRPPTLGKEFTGNTGNTLAQILFSSDTPLALLENSKDAQRLLASGVNSQPANHPPKKWSIRSLFSSHSSTSRKESSSSGGSSPLEEIRPGASEALILREMYYSLSRLPWERIACSFPDGTAHNKIIAGNFQGYEGDWRVSGIDVVVHLANAFMV